MPLSIDFRIIKPDLDSRDRAFEDLCYQLVLPIEKLPEGISLLRHGTLDGGVEMYTMMPEGVTKFLSYDTVHPNNRTERGESFRLTHIQ